MSDRIVSHPATDAYRDNWERIFKPEFVPHVHEWPVDGETCEQCREYRAKAKEYESALDREGIKQ